jgi:8-oxo-dGTP pyrophosphatase MutT (NUDIX family)
MGDQSKCFLSSDSQIGFQKRRDFVAAFWYTKVMAKTHKKIPDEAVCVFNGKLFDVFQWKQSMFDGSTATFERVRRPHTVQLIAVTEDKKIILVKERQPDMDGPVVGLPGGRIDGKELPEVAALRELEEETGYHSDTCALWLEERPVSKMDWTIYTYIAKDCKKINAPSLDGGEEIETILVTYDEFLKRVQSELFPSDDVARTVMRMLLDGSEPDFKKILGCAS